METADKKYLPELIGKGYGDFWKFKGRYRVVKGSRASKKSKTTALWYIVNLIKYPTANLLVVRKTERTLQNSCYSELLWAINRLGVSEYFRATVKPLEITYTPTGQKILFRGLDDALKIASISVHVGSLCWLWVEEAYEITNESDFDTLDESIRGEVAEGLFKQTTITFNPWSDRSWLKKRFFDVPPDDDILAKTTNYTINEWLDESDKRTFERMRANNPQRYKVAGLGDWGITDGLVYERWREESFNVQDITQKPNVCSAFGLDFGYTNDPTALFCGLISMEEQRIWVFDELYEKGLLNKHIFERIVQMGYSKEKIIADCAEPKSIDDLNELGLRVRRAKKARGNVGSSIRNGIQFLQGFEIVVHPRCVNFLNEISCYTWKKDKFGNSLNEPVDDYNHLLDAMRYATEEYNRGKTFSFD